MAFAAFAAAFLVGAAIERLAARPGSGWPSPAALPARLAVHLTLYLFWFATFRRPLVAAAALVVTIAILTAISRKKRALVHEPLSFSDFALVRLIVRHPDLYYTEALLDPRALVGLVAFLFATGLWLHVEPPALAVGTAAGLLVGVALAVALSWAFAARPLLSHHLRRALPQPAVERDLAAWGLLAMLVVYGLRWRAELAWPLPDPGDADEDVRLEAAPRLVVVLQLESFLDPARIGLVAEPLPGLAAARARSVLYGPLAVPAHGAFTMRSEFAVLTGLGPEALGFRRFDPFLSVGFGPTDTLASRLAARGFATTFMHPFRAGFFNRERVTPHLGFQRLLWEEHFGDAERVGPYLGDRVLVAGLLAEIAREAGRPRLVMAVSMENHGPWQPGRLAQEADPAAQYLLHLRNTDAAIGDVVAGLAACGEPALLCLFGDHPPILPWSRTLPAETDYALVAFGDLALPSPREQPLTAHALGRVVARMAGAERPRPD